MLVGAVLVGVAGEGVRWYRRRRRWLNLRCAIVVVAAGGREENAAWIWGVGGDKSA